jgi:hypothetical protein
MFWICFPNSDWVYEICFFYARTSDDGWMFVDPDGCAYLSIGVCSTAPHDEVADHSSSFAKNCDDDCKKMAVTKDDPWLIGHFSDNGLPFVSKDVLKRFLRISSRGESHAAAAQFLEKKGIKEDAIKSQHDTEFMALVLKAYYKTVHDAMHKYDPNHL